MTVEDFFTTQNKAEDAFGDSKQHLFGIHFEGQWFLSDGERTCVEVTQEQYREADTLFGAAYDKDLSTTPALKKFTKEIF